jgi:ABC-2 type transport system permease protein
MFKLIKLHLLQERIRTLVWLIAVVGVSALTAPALREMFSDESGKAGRLAMMENPAMVAMAGPVYGLDDYNVARMFSSEMFIFTVIAVMMMNVFLVVRHTRADEEHGNLEVLYSRPISRELPLISAFISATLINLVIAVCLFGALFCQGVEGFTFMGTAVYCLAIFVSGLLAVALTAVLAQCFALARSVTVNASLLIGIAYIIRAVGDVTKPLDFLSYISPLGLILRVAPWVDNNFYPIVILLFETLALGVLAFYLHKIRDYDQSFFRTKNGRKDAGAKLKFRLVGMPFGLIYRQNRGVIWGWLATMFIFGVSYGSIMGSLDGFVNGNEMISQMVNLTADADKPIATMFIGMLVVVMCIFASCPAVVIMLKLNGEEKRGRLDPVYIHTVSRLQYFIGFTIVAVILGALSDLMAFLGFYSSSSISMEQPFGFMELFKSFAVYIPAIVLVLSVVVLVVGLKFAPGAVSWGYFTLTFAIAYLGDLLKLPDWTKNFFGFSHTPNLMLEDMKWQPICIMLAVSLVFLSVGAFGYTKRDV